jgi:hypothetical protein
VLRSLGSGLFQPSDPRCSNSIYPSNTAHHLPPTTLHCPVRSQDMSKSLHIPQDKNQPMPPESHSKITRQMSRRAPSCADFASNAPSENDSQGVAAANLMAVSKRPSWSREPHRADNPPTAGTAAIPTSQSHPVTTTTRHKDISDSTSPETQPRDRQVSSGRKVNIVF